MNRITDTTTGYIAPPLPHDKDYHVYTVSANDVDDWVRSLLSRLEKHGFKCVYRDRDFKFGRIEVCNINSIIDTCWKYILIVSPDYIELADLGEEPRENGTPLVLENGVILENKCNDKTNVVCLVLKGCILPPVLKIFRKIDVKHNPHWFIKLLKALGATKAKSNRETSFRYCAMCQTDFEQDFRLFQCSVCKEIGCLGCCNYYACVTPNFIRTDRVCQTCFLLFTEGERTLKLDGNYLAPTEDVSDLTNDPEASRYGFQVLYHFQFGGSFKQKNSTRSTPKYCDMCKRTSNFGMQLLQCSLCFDIACVDTCVKFYAPLTQQQLRMGRVCRRCFQKRDTLIRQG